MGRCGVTGLITEKQVINDHHGAPHTSTVAAAPSLGSVGSGTRQGTWAYGQDGLQFPLYTWGAWDAGEASLGEEGAGEGPRHWAGQEWRGAVCRRYVGSSRGQNTTLDPACLGVPGRVRMPTSQTQPKEG